MIASIIATPIPLSFRPTLTRGVPPSTERMELPPHSTRPTLPSRRSPKITLIILILTLPSLILWRWATYHPLIPVLPHSIELLRVAGLATLDTPQPQRVSSRLYRRWNTRLLTLNHQRHLIRQALHLFHHGFLKSLLISFQPSFHLF